RLGTATDEEHDCHPARKLPHHARPRPRKRPQLLHNNEAAKATHNTASTSRAAPKAVTAASDAAAALTKNKTLTPSERRLTHCLPPLDTLRSANPPSPSRVAARTPPPNAAESSA